MSLLSRVFLQTLVKMNSSLNFTANRGFSLVELLVVIAVIAIIAAIAIPSIANVTNQAEEAKDRRNAQTVASLAGAAKAVGATEDLSTPTAAMYALQQGINVVIGGTTNTFQIGALTTREASGVTKYLSIPTNFSDPTAVVFYAPEGGSN